MISREIEFNSVAHIHLILEVKRRDDSLCDFPEWNLTQAIRLS